MNLLVLLASLTITSDAELALRQTVLDSLPRIQSERLTKRLNSKKAVFYSRQTLTPAYQDWFGALNGVHAVSNNVSANHSEPFGNANREYPWGEPFGTHLCENVVGVNAMLLPPDHAIAYYRSPSGTYRWVFPEGTIFVEFLYERGPKGDVMFAINTREKLKGVWVPDSHRPFVSRKQFLDALRRDLPDEVVDGMDQEMAATRKAEIIGNPHPGETVFASTTTTEVLPKLSEEHVYALLQNTSFKSAYGKSWSESNPPVHAPTSKQPFNVVPGNYTAGFVSIDEDSCMRCHSTVTKTASHFEAGRDWYGQVRGSDGIFTFHPFSESSISHVGTPQPVGMRGDLIEAGLLEPYDAAKHANYHDTTPENR